MIKGSYAGDLVLDVIGFIPGVGYLIKGVKKVPFKEIGKGIKKGIKEIPDIWKNAKNGIDLIFKNNTPPPEIVIVESKFKTIGKKPPDEPLLTTNKINKQMDDNWIEVNLDKAVGDEKAREIRDILKQDKKNYKLNGNTGTVNILKLASLIDQTGNIRYFEIGRDVEILRELSKIEVEQILKN